MDFRLLVIAVIVPNIQCVDRKRLAQIPEPAANFDIAEIDSGVKRVKRNVQGMKFEIWKVHSVNIDSGVEACGISKWSRGVWYNQARYVSCSFSGSRAFSDIRFRNVVTGNKIKQEAVWRDGFCTEGNFDLIPCKGGRGAFKLIDPIGDMLTGDQIIVVYDAKKGYEITYGCTKLGVNNECADTWIAVKTRKRLPSDYVMKCAERELKRLYDLSFAEMSLVSQNNPC